MSTHITTLKNGLEKRGHEVDVLSFTDIAPFKKKLVAQMPGFFLNKFHQGAGQLLNDRSRMKLLRNQTAKKYDVINTQDIFATLALTNLGMPIVGTVHGYYTYEATSRGAITENSPVYNRYLALEKKAYQAATSIVTVDQRISDYIFSLSNVKTNVIQNFINIDLFHQQKKVDPASPVLLIPRRLTAKNGVRYPLHALKKVLEIYPTVTLVYAGSGEELTALRTITKELNIEANVKFLGSVPHQEMLRWYQKANIVLIPSVHSNGVEEATSIAALEAMASGTPVIASSVGGLKQIITDGLDGMLVQEKSPQQISDCVIDFLHDKEKADTLAEQARAKIKQDYSHIAAAERFENIYIDALKSNYI